VSDSLKVRLQDFFGRRMASPRAHARMYRLTNGRIGHGSPPRSVLLLTVTGRKSGRQWTTPVAYFDIDGKRALAATNIGREGPPEWFRNIRANPAVTTQVRAQVNQAMGRITQGEEREQLWSRMKIGNPLYERYELRSPDGIPVVVLEPIGEPPAGGTTRSSTLTAQ